MQNGKNIYNLTEKLFPICRSLTGNGVRKTLHIMQEIIPELTIHEVPTGAEVFDWTVPKEWNINDAFIKDSNGNKIVDFNNSNLHVMGYSTPVNKKVNKTELLQYIYTEPSQPEAIPYITSYYKERFGFCITENQKKQIESDYNDNDEFEMFIDSALENGNLTYGEIIIPPPPPMKIIQKTIIKKYFFQHIFAILHWLIMNYQVRVFQFILLTILKNYRKEDIHIDLYLYRKLSVL